MERKIKQLIRFEKVKEFYNEYERFFLPLALLVGLVVDTITFRSVDIDFVFTLLTVYLIVSGFTIAFVNLYDHEVFDSENNLLKYIRLSAPVLIQFTFGALLGASFIFYWFSGDISVSWPFMLVLVVLMISNDVFREYYLKPPIQITVYFFIIFSVSNLLLPFILNTMGPEVFLASGAVSLLIISIYLYLLFKLIPSLRKLKTILFSLVLFVFGSMNFFYFANIIPPIPLSLREAGVYHKVDKTETGRYKILKEEESFFDNIVPGQSIKITNDGRVYVYTAIFAPADLKTDIIHHWQYFDENRKRWVSKDKLSFPIIGGRKSGYRGFSLKSNVKAGNWRVDVETQSGRLIGRVEFDIIIADEKPKLEIKYK